MTKEKPKLLTSDVRQRTALFNELASALFWFSFHMIKGSAGPKQLEAPEPALLQRLRTEEVQKRDEQSRRDRPRS
jgi:cell division protein FtsB